MLTPNATLESELAPSQLDAVERAKLKELEAIVERGLETFYEVGKAVLEIRDRKLYRQTHKTFEAYCRNKWSITRRRAYQFIDAVQVMENLCTDVHKIPTKESQVRPLSKLPPELQLEIWQKAVESVPNGIPTGVDVKRLVEEQAVSRTTKQESGEETSELARLRLENQQLKQQIRQQNTARERRAAEVAAELERLREENKQLRAELRRRDIEWEQRLALERVKIREELRAEIRAEIKAEYEDVINNLTRQLQEMTAKYEAVVERLEAIEGAKA